MTSTWASTALGDFLGSFGFPPLLWFSKLDISQKLKPIMVSGAAQYLFVIGRVGLMVALDGEPFV